MWGEGEPPCRILLISAKPTETGEILVMMLIDGKEVTCIAARNVAAALVTGVTEALAKGLRPWEP